MRLSVIIPARNAAGDLPILLDALNPQLHPGDECLLVNDDSTDSTLDVAASYPIRVFSLKTRSGPAATRNLGASEAVGDVLVFLDSDVVPHADLLERMRRHFLANEILAAVIGSYDDQPASTAQVSRFRNLLHCYTHRTGNRRASTFWAGCGAIRRHVFEAAGGFDQRRYLEPSIEDIELGVRLRRSGAFILLDPELQVQHRKVWTLPVMLRTDVWNRAVPWSRNWILASRQAPADLNLKVSQRCLVPPPRVTILASAAICSLGAPAGICCHFCAPRVRDLIEPALLQISGPVAEEPGSRSVPFRCTCCTTSRVCLDLLSRPQGSFDPVANIDK